MTTTARERLLALLAEDPDPTFARSDATLRGWVQGLTEGDAVTKPPLPAGMFDPFPLIEVDTSDGSPFARILRLATSAAHGWTFSSDGPYKTPGQTGAQITRAEITEGLLHLLELGFIDIDVERLEAAPGIPLHREIRVTERRAP